MIKHRNIMRNASGQAVVEAAMTMLLLFMLIFAIFEVGRLIQVQQTLTDAAREGARRSVAPLTQTDILAPDVVAVVQSYLSAASLNSAAATVTVNQNVTFPPAFTSYTQVTVTYPYRVMTLLIFGNLNMTLTGQSLMRNETSQ